MPKPGDVFLSILGVFAILVPGALLAYLLSDDAISWARHRLPAVSDPAERWVAFAIAAFLLGQALYALGSWLLDPLYGFIYVPYKTAKKRRRGLHSLQARIRDLMGVDATVTTSYPWARAFVGVRNPNAATAIERLDADSKFFRALTLALLFTAFRLVSSSGWLTCGALVLLASAAFLRFCHQRWERDETAYEFVLVLRSSDQPARTPMTTN
jgi:hypothetical protein